MLTYYTEDRNIIENGCMPSDLINAGYYERENDYTCRCIKEHKLRIAGCARNDSSNIIATYIGFWMNNKLTEIYPWSYVDIIIPLNATEVCFKWRTMSSLNLFIAYSVLE